MDTPSESAWLGLEWAVRALAQPADVQLSLFPDFVCFTCELVSDFDHWLGVVFGQPPAFQPNRFAGVALAGVEAIRMLKEALDDIDGEEYEEWCFAIEPLRSDVRWERIRHRARAAIHLMGWSEAPPPADRSTYVRGLDRE